MKIVHLVAGAGGMYCGSCLRDNALATELLRRGHDVVLMPVYTPTLTDESSGWNHFWELTGSREVLKGYAQVVREVAEMTGALERGAETIRENYLRRVDLAVTAIDRYTLGRVHGLEGVFKKLALHLNFFGERITMQKLKIDNFARLIKSFSPQAVLERGYAVVRKEGKVISSVKDLKARDVIGLRLKDGEIGAEVL